MMTSVSGKAGSWFSVIFMASLLSVSILADKGRGARLFESPQGTHFQEGIHEDIWELWYRQTASDEGQPHHSSKGKLRRKLRELRKKLPVYS